MYEAGCDFSFITLIKLVSKHSILISVFLLIEEVINFIKGFQCSYRNYYVLSFILLVWYIMICISYCYHSFTCCYTPFTGILWETLSIYSRYMNFCLWCILLWFGIFGNTGFVEWLWTICLPSILRTFKKEWQ